MSQRIAIFRGSFDPPGSRHRAAAEELARRFDEVIVMPHGPWPDKPELADTSPVHRAALTDMTFEGVPGVRVDLSDLERGVFTFNHELDARHDGAEVSHVVTAEDVLGGADSASLIHREWDRGPEMWKRLHFTVLVPKGEDVPAEDLPPRSEVIPIDAAVPSKAIRSMVYLRQPIAEWVVPRALAYIERHNLFRGVEPLRETWLHVDSPRLLVVWDERNEKSRDLAERLRPMESDDPELIVVLGGDGTMLHAIREHWDKRLPFYGMNTGHIGFLLNHDLTPEFWKHELVVYELPLLWVQVEPLDGEPRELLAFNDAWVERSTGQTAWIRVAVDQQVRFEKLVSDGALISTAAGSTSYARAMGATPVPMNTRVLVVCGSNVLRPLNWKPALVPFNSEIEFVTLDSKKRPLRGFVDGEDQGLLRALRARVSHIAAVELAFCRGYDPVTKLTELQFPKID